MAFSKVKVGGLADDSVTAANIDDDGTGYTVGNLTNSGTLQQTGQVTLGSGGTNWTLPTARGTNKYVLQINGTTGASTWAESLTAPEISSHNFDVSGSTDDGGINQYEAPYEYTGTTNATTTISALSSTTGLLAGQYISGAGIPADTTIVSVNSGASTMVISNAVTVTGTQTGVPIKIQKTPGEKNGGKVILTGTNFGATIGELTVAITDSGGGIIASASYLSGLSGGTSVVAEWTGTEGDYATKLKPGHSDYIGDSGLIYFKMTKSGLSSNVHNTNTTLTSDPAVTTLSGSSQTGGDVSTDPTSSSLGVYGSGRTAGGGQEENTKLLLNFDRTGGTDIEDSSNKGGDGHKVTVNTNAAIKASPFGDGKSAMFFDGTDDFLLVADSNDWHLGGTTNWTIEWWQYCTKSSGTNRPFSNSSSNTSGVIFYFTSGGEPHLLTGDGSNWKHDVTGSAGDIKFNQWQHIAITKATNTITIFIDGKQKATQTVSGMGDANVSGFTIGKWAYASHPDPFGGYIDEFRIVHSVVYTGDFTVPTSRLTAITNTKLLIHSNKGSYGVHHGIESQRSYTITTNATSYGSGTLQDTIDGGTTNNYGLNDAQNVATGPLHFTIDLGEYAVGAARTEVFNKFFWTQSSYGASNDQTHGNWKIQYWNGSSWNDATGGSITDLGDTANAHDFTNTTAYQKYRILGVSGTTDSSPYIHEMGFANATFTDSSSSTHDITPTGVYHSQGHGGIDPAMTWPASGKATGSAGVYFDGSSYIQAADSADVDLGNSDFTIDFWLYHTGQFPTSPQSVVEKWSTYKSYAIRFDTNLNKLEFLADRDGSHGGAWDEEIEFNNTGITAFTWYHIAFTKDANELVLYVNGKYIGNSTALVGDTLNATTDPLRIGSGDNKLYGYVDQFRLSKVRRYYGTNTNNWSNFTDSGTSVAWTQPTRVFGAYGTETPDVGTITLTATGEGDFTWSEMSAGTALPGTLAVGSTTHSGSGNSRTHTATITGAFTSAVQSDTATNNILLKVQHDTDATKAVTLNGTTGMSITQMAAGKPVLFSGRRYLGNGVSGRKITNLGFQPDLVWFKNRDTTDTHALFDSVRGATYRLRSDDTQANTQIAEGLKSFDSDGFTVGNNNGVNYDTKAQIAWAWKAGGAPSSSELSLSGGVGAGIITSGLTAVSTVTQSVNQNSGFSITKYTGSTSQGVFPHNLGAKPDWIIIKNLTDSGGWICWHTGLNNDAVGAGMWIHLHESGARAYNGSTAQSGWNYFNALDSTNITLAGNSGVNNSSKNYICYAWTAVTGVSAFGTYEGTGGALSVTDQSGATNCGFKPRFVMVKNIDVNGRYWAIQDAFRTPGDTSTTHLYADLANADDTHSIKTMNFTNTGFEFTSSSTYHSINENGQTFIYIAFA